MLRSPKLVRPQLREARHLILRQKLPPAAQQARLSERSDCFRCCACHGLSAVDCLSCGGSRRSMHALALCGSFSRVGCAQPMRNRADAARQAHPGFAVAVVSKASSKALLMKTPPTKVQGVRGGRRCTGAASHLAQVVQLHIELLHFGQYSGFGDRHACAPRSRRYEAGCLLLFCAQRSCAPLSPL